MKKLISLFLLLSAFSINAAAQTVYGALAIDKSNGFYYGWAYDYATLPGAENRAIKECKAKGGDCTVVLTWEGKGCAAYRTIPGTVGTAYGWGVAPTQSAADAIATREALKRSRGVQPTNYVWACNTVGEFKEKKNEPDPTLNAAKSQEANKQGATSFTVKSVKIGSQEWMSQNLTVRNFRNGDPIKKVTSWEEWFKHYKSNTPAYIEFQTEPYGGIIYNRAAVNDPRGLAPAGWHIPTKEEWLELIDYAGGGQSGMSALISVDHWTYRNGRDKYGFNALPVGFYENSRSKPEYGAFCNWWTSTLYDASSNVTINASQWDTSQEIKPRNQSHYGCYIRLIKD